MIWRKQQPPAQSDEGPRGFDEFDTRLGDILRGERATLGKSLLDVQRELHIRAAHIAAIENGDLSAFETPSFVAGFVRSYARYLGLDPEQVYERFCKENDFHVGHGMAPGAPSSTSRLAPQRPANPGAAEWRQGAPLRGIGMTPPSEPFWHRIEPGALGSITVLTALILGLGLTGWTVLREVQQVHVAPADVVPTVVSDFNPLTPGAATGALGLDTDPLTAAPGTGVALAQGAPVAEGVVRLARPEALETPVLVPRDGPIAAIIPDTRPADPLSIATDSAVAQALAEVTPAPQVVAQLPGTVELLAVRPSWLRVRAADGSVIFERILDAGETYAIPATEAPPTLHAGNSGSVYFLIDGQPYGPVAPGAQVVRNVSLDVDVLRQTYAQADLSGDQDLAVFVARLADER